MAAVRKAGLALPLPPALEFQESSPTRIPADDHTFDAAYTWDNEGRMTGINYGPWYAFTYDANGRLGGMSGSDLTMTASYGVAGEMLGLTYFGYGETRTKPGRK